MRTICLTLPTNRPCAPAIRALGEEAVYAAEHFDVVVHLLVLDSCDGEAFAAHARAVWETPRPPNVLAHHLDEPAQRAFLRRVIRDADLAKPDLMLDLMLPAEPSYGACTNRAFLIAAALGCQSIHRRDSDSRYQTSNGAPVFPIHHELRSLGRPAKDAARHVSATTLDPRHAPKPVTMVGSSFVGEPSVDLAEIHRLDPQIYADVVGLWAPGHWTEQAKRELAAESFRGAGTKPFTRDHSTLGLVDPMRVDMCNISFHRVHERVPLPPATNTIGSDYFLIHLVHDAGLPGVLHNRNIVNFYTGERRTDPGFPAYQTRFAKFLLSMLYLNFLYDRMAAAGDALLDDHHQVRAPAVAALVRESTALDRTENVERLDVLDASYRQLGGKYAAFADTLAPRRERLLHEAGQDMADFALLIEAWAALIDASRATGPYPLTQQPDRDRR